MKYRENVKLRSSKHLYTVSLLDSTAFADTQGAGIQPYKFGNKELDADHGLMMYDYSARYYNGISFTSIDPLAEKYYSISPYVYCANNPMRYVDPTGMVLDDFRLDKEGNLHLIKKTDANNHTIYATNSKGGIDKNNSIDVDKSFIGNKQSETVLAQYSSAADGNNAIASLTVDTYTSLDNKKATAFFEFASNNTDTEWSQTKISANGIEASLITNSHDYGGEVGQSKLASDIIVRNKRASLLGSIQISILDANHSHTNGSTTVSHGDSKLALKIQGAFINARMHNYSPMTREYTPFSKHSIPGELPEFIIRPKK